MDDISIDRLVLDIPGFTAEQGKQVARRVAEGLSIGGAQLAAQPVDRAKISIMLEPSASATDTERLANSILTALLRQIG